MNLKIKSGKMLVKAALVAVSMSVVSVASTGTAGAQEAFIGQDADTTAGVVNPAAGDDGLVPLSRAEEGVHLDNYWNFMRMLRATPIEEELEVSRSVKRDITEDKPETVTPEIPDREVEASAPLATSAPTETAVSTRSRMTNAGAANGKIFFSQLVDGVYKDFVCSGSVVNSNNRSTIVTAGHCVHSGAGGEFHKNWVFVPGYSFGSAPYGKYTSNYMITTNDWATYGASYRGFAADLAVVTVNTDNGRRVADLVGGHGIRSGNAGSFNGDIVGYPGNRYYGFAMHKCTTPIASQAVANQDFYWASGCNFGAGASGGPWLEDFNGQLGIIRSVSSFGPTSGTAYLGAPIITEDFWAMLDAAENRQVS